MSAGRDGGRPRLLVLRALKLGDFLTGLPALRALARAFPDHERILAAPSRFEELIGQTGMHRICPTSDLAPLPPELNGAEVAVDLHGRGPESQQILLDRHPGRLISFRCAELVETAHGPRWRPDEHEVQRWCRMLRESGIGADPRDLLLHRPFGSPRRSEGGHSRSEDRAGSYYGATDSPRPHGATIIHPGAASQARRWPAARFAAVARSELGGGRRVLITGGAEETDLAYRVALLAGLPPDCVLAGNTSLTALAELVAAAGRVVSGDTGIAHLATATGTPSVVLFGPVPPAEWGPPALPHHIAIWTGKRGDPHAPTTDPGLLEIGVDRVLEALGRLPERRPLPGLAG